MDIAKHLSYIGCVLPNLFGGSGAAGEPFDLSIGGGLTARCFMAWPQGHSVLEDWDALSSSAGRATAFSTPAWQGALARPFARVGRYRLVTLSDHGNLLGVLPLQARRNGILETPGEMISDYLDPLLETLDPSAGWAALLSLMRSLPGAPTGELIMHNVRSDAPWLSELGSVAGPEGFDLQVDACATTSRIMLPKTWDDYLASLPQHDRKELRRKIRNAQTKAGARLMVLDSDDPKLPQELERAFDFMKVAGGVKGIKATWMYRPLFRRATPGLIKSHRLRVYCLMLNEQPASVLICFPCKEGPMMWAGGWDMQMREWSPGIVLFGMAIQHSIDNGATCFDLLRGQSRYKKELGATDVPIHRLTLRRKAA
jgi:CelD/BcsL family acetyltransferase involved in cellulose biosynthesis